MSIVCFVTSISSLYSQNTSIIQKVPKQLAQSYQCHNNKCEVVAYASYCSVGGTGCRENNCPMGYQ